MTLEVVLMWSAVTFYAASSIVFVIGMVFGKPRLDSVALWVGLAGLVPHAAAIVVRWVRVEHGPYLGFYEVVSSYAFISVAALGVIAWQRRSLSQIGVLLMPIAFLMLGASMFTPRADLAITGALASWWLTIHVVFAKLCYGAFVASFALGVLYLARGRATGLLAEALERLPRQEEVDDLVFRFVAVGFVFLGIMIVAGAIWANEAWGRYWGWDPIETWSLITWMIYALYLHARMLLGWRGRRSAWFAVIALPVVLFTLIGVPLVYNSIHGAYLLGF